MSIERRIDQLVELGNYIRSNGDELQKVKALAKLHNPWFTIENIDHALASIAEKMLEREVLGQWVSKYTFGAIQKKVGLILAGNIPLVGFHDILCVYLSGHTAWVKASSKDSALTIHLVEQLSAPDEVHFVDKLGGVDAVIATGSNHSAKQFERYFSNLPRIIRRNRNAVAVLGVEVSEKDILALGRDVFTYFGLGCRNVSKIYIPKGFEKTQLMEVLHEEYKDLILHSKYKNNYDYNHAVYLLNGEEFMASGAVLLRPHKDIISRIACLHYEEYDSEANLASELKGKMDEIQCISGNIELDGLHILPLGKCQEPEIDDYADGVDTMAFLSKLSS